jgi:hypothetical protein
MVKEYSDGAYRTELLAKHRKGNKIEDDKSKIDLDTIPCNIRYLGISLVISKVTCP